jgi:RNA polymerase sigma-70 factor (ECF subfamily)
VLTIVRNTSYSWLAKNRPSAIVLLGDLGEEARQQLDQADPDPSPEAQLIAKTDSAAMRRLPDCRSGP